MSDQLLRHGGTGGSHSCDPPESPTKGDVWQCNCGRRWTAVRRPPARGGYQPVANMWVRRYWPWPRLGHGGPDAGGGYPAGGPVVDKLPRPSSTKAPGARS